MRYAPNLPIENRHRGSIKAVGGGNLHTEGGGLREVARRRDGRKDEE
jgi:hypothetical protein